MFSVLVKVLSRKKEKAGKERAGALRIIVIGVGIVMVEIAGTVAVQKSFGTSQVAVGLG